MRNECFMRFERLAQDGQARRGRLSFPRGTVEPPAFMPVGTDGTGTGLTPQAVVGAVEHAARGGDRLIDRRDFRAAGGADLGGLASLGGVPSRSRAASSRPCSAAVRPVAPRWWHAWPPTT